MKIKSLIIIIIISIAVLALTPVLTFKITTFHFEPKTTLEEFHEKFDDENIVRHFKSAHPEHLAEGNKPPA